MSFVDALRHRIRTALRSEHADRERAEEYEIHQSLAQEQRTHDGASVRSTPASRRGASSETRPISRKRRAGWA